MISVSQAAYPEVTAPARMPLSAQAVLVMAVLLVLVSGCARSAGVSKAAGSVNPEAAKGTAYPGPQALSDGDIDALRDDIAALAARVDQGFEDGWIAGHSSRVLKSGYRRIDPEIKADFACAYRKFIEKRHQNLALDMSTYVPYSDRFQFGLDFWRSSKAAEKFAAETVKKQVVWVHESLLDASELFFRAYEARHPGTTDSFAVLAHDREQDMVFDYMENQGKRGSYSDTYVKWAGKLKSSK